MSEASVRPGIDVVIVTWNSARWITPCLDALEAARHSQSPRIIVVDNASSDDSLERARAHPIGARVIGNERNLGFGGANNIGWRAGDREFVVFLNPDTQVRPGWLEPIIEDYRTDEHTAIVGCKLLDPDETTLQHAGGFLYGNAMSAHHGAGQIDRGQYDGLRQTPYVSGAAMAVRRSVLMAMGGFDEAFFPAYFEEINLCLRARSAGWRVMVDTRSVVIHHESVSLGRASARMVRLLTRGRAILARQRFSAADWLFRFMPAELAWFRSWMATSARRAIVRSYLDMLGITKRP